MANNLNGFSDYVKDKIEYTLNIIPFGKLITTAKNNPELVETLTTNPIEVFNETSSNLKKAGIYFAIGGVSIIALIGLIKLRELRVI